MDLLLLDLFKLGTSLLIGLIIGWEREEQDKQAGLRTISLITLGATLVVMMTLKWDVYKLNNSFDAIRAIAYYLVAIGFVGGGIIYYNRGKLQGITTASLLLPMSIIGILIGMEEFTLAIISGILIYFILKLKYIKVTIEKRRKKCRRKKQR